GVSRRPSRSGSSPMATRISRTAASIRAWSTGATTGAPGASPSSTLVSSVLPRVDIPTLRDLDHLLGRVLLAGVLRRAVAVRHRPLLGLREHRALAVDRAGVGGQPDRSHRTLADVLE